MSTNRPLRIGMLSQSLSRHSGGVAEAMRLFGNAVRADNPRHELHVFAKRDAASDQDAPLYDGWQVHLARGFGPDRFSFSPGLLRAMLAADLDVLHIHGLWQAHALGGWLWHRITGRPVVISPHGMLEPWIMANSARSKQIVGRLFQNDLMRRAAIIHALTGAERDQALALFPGHKGVEVLPNYVSTPETPETQRPAWWRPDFEGRRVYLFLGRIHRKKGVNELCRAWADLCTRDSGFAARSALVICGWVDHDAEIEATLARTQAALGNMLYAGPQFGKEKWRSLAAANVFVLPSKSEGLPMGVLEAWGMGLPGLLSLHCNLPEGFEAGAALRCGTGEGEIAEGLEAVDRLDTQALAAMADKARALVAERFSQPRIASRLIALYTAIAVPERQP
jgi:glycosyltransferase involved in cell wall biosynthesis